MPLWSAALPTPTLPTPRVWRVIEAIWPKLRADPRHAGPILSAELRAARTLGSKERPVAGDVLTGLIRHERALARLDPGHIPGGGSRTIRAVRRGRSPRFPPPRPAPAVGLLRARLRLGLRGPAAPSLAGARCAALRIPTARGC